MKTFVCNQDIDVTDAVLKTRLTPDVALFVRRLVDEAGIRFVKPVKVYADANPDEDSVNVTLE